LKTLKFSKSVNIDSATWLRTSHLEPPTISRSAPRAGAATAPY